MKESDDGQIGKLKEIDAETSKIWIDRVDYKKLEDKMKEEMCTMEWNKRKKTILDEGECIHVSAVTD